jgi:hypothetical protein
MSYGDFTAAGIGIKKIMPGLVGGGGRDYAGNDLLTPEKGPYVKENSRGGRGQVVLRSK